MGYQPTEIGIREMDARPYGNSPDAHAEELRRAKQLAEAQGGGPVPAAPSPKPSRGNIAVADPRIPPPTDVAMGPGPYVPPIRPPMEPTIRDSHDREPVEDDSIFGVTGALNALDYITQSGVAAAGAAMEAAGVDMPFGLGKKGPTDATQADAFIPAAARWVLDTFMDTNASVAAIKAGVAAGGGEGGQEAVRALSPTQQAISARLQELVARGAAEDDALHLASLEETYNRLGAVGSVAAGLILGIPATFAAAVGTAYRLTYGEEEFGKMAALGERRLETGSFARSAVEFGIPELGLVTGAVKAVQVARLRFAAGMKVADDALRADAAVQYAEDVATVERATAADLAVDSSTEARITQAEIASARVRADVEVARTTGDATTLLNEADDATFMSGIRAAVEALPAHERATVSVGEAIVKAQRAAKASFTRAMRTALSKGEILRMENVTVGADIEGQAIRQRRMVGQFDEAVENMRNAFRSAGKSSDEITALMAPFLRARAVAAETLAAIDARNAVIKADIKLSRTERTQAFKEVREARKAQAKAEKKVEQAQKTEGKAEEKVEKQEAKETAKQTQTVDRLQQQIDQQKARIERERETIGKIKGDKEPTVTSQADLLTYGNAEDVRWLEEHGVTNIPAWGPTTTRAMREWFEADPTRISLGYEHVGWRAITEETSELTGVSLEKIRANLPATGEMTKAFYILNQVFGAKLRAWREMGQMVKNGLASPEQMVEATKDLMLLQSDLRRGIGEVARTLGSQRLLKKPDLVELVRLQKVVHLRYADVERVAKRIDALEGYIAEAQAAKPLSEMVTGLRSELEAAVRESQTALAALEDAKRAVSEATERNLRAALDLAAKKAVSPEKAAVWALYDGEDLVDLAAELRKLEPAGFGSFAQRGLLSGRYGRSPSQILNWVGTGINGYTIQAVRPLAGAMARIPKVGAQARAGISEPLFVPGETKAAWMAMFRAQPDAWRFFGGTFWNGSAEDIAIRHGVADWETLIGEGVDTGLTNFRFPRVVPERFADRAPAFLGGREFEMTGPKALPYDATLRALYASDGYWRIQFNDAEAVARSMREAAVNNDIEGMARSFVEADRKVRAEAARLGRVETFNEPFSTQKGFDKTLNEFLGAKNWGGLQPMRLAIPAARFGKRAVEAGFRLSGGGLITGYMKAGRAASVGDKFEKVSLARQAAMEQAQGAIGASLLFSVAMLDGGGIFSGARPKTEEERLAWERIGKKPMSVKIGDTWVPLGWFASAGVPFALAGSIKALMDDEDDATVADRVGRASQALGQYMWDQPALSLTRLLFDGLNNAIQYGSTTQLERLLANAFKPGAATQSAAESFTAVFDKYERDPEGIIQMLLAKLPGASMTVPPKIDPATGKPQERSVTGVPALFQSEFQSAGQEKTPDDPVERAIVEVGAGVTSMERSVTSGKGPAATVRLTQDEYVRLSARAGSLGREVAAIALRAPEYQNSDPRGKQSIIEMAYERARTAARKELAKSMLAQSRTPEDAQRALIVSRASLEAEEYEAMVKLLWSKGMLTDQVVRNLDESRPSFRSPSVEEMIR